MAFRQDSWYVNDFIIVINVIEEMKLHATVPFKRKEIKCYYSLCYSFIDVFPVYISEKQKMMAHYMEFSVITVLNNYSVTLVMH